MVYYFLAQLNFLFAGGEQTTEAPKTENDPLLSAIQEVRDEIKHLVKGFGGKPAGEGAYAENIRQV